MPPAIGRIGGESLLTDLNLPIAPMFSWLYLQTGDAKWLQRSNVRAGGVELVNRDPAKRFNRNCRSRCDLLLQRAERLQQWDLQ